MKQYLMTGIAAIAMCAAFTSCSHDLGFEQMNQEEAIQSKYEAAFIKAFGQPAPDQDWGFGTITRGITRGKGDNSCGTCIKPDMTNFPNYYTQYPNYTTPAPITTGERAYVKQWFEEHPGFTEGLDIQNFYVQHVWGQASKNYNVWYEAYDQNYIKNVLIPNFETLRNALLETTSDLASVQRPAKGDSTKYVTTLSKDDPRFGSSNTDYKTWGNDTVGFSSYKDGIYRGPSYTMMQPVDKEKGGQDMVNYYNMQIKKWEHELELNEQAKVTAIEERKKWLGDADKKEEKKKADKPEEKKTK